MATSPRTQKATGSARKASSSTQKTAAGSARKASGTKQKTAAGSAQKAGSASKRSAAGTKPKATSSRQQASTGTRRKVSTSTRQKASSQPKKGIYVYGIIPADVELAEEMPGVGDPPGQVRVIRSDGLAALVSEVDTSRPLGSPQDLVAHEQIVDATAAEVPVLPARFGAVMSSKEEVTEDLLAANHDEFDDALEELEGRAQFVVKGRYVEQPILSEVLSENRQAGHLANKLRELLQCWRHGHGSRTLLVPDLD